MLRALVMGLVGACLVAFTGAAFAQKRMALVTGKHKGSHQSRVRDAFG